MNARIRLALIVTVAVWSVSLPATVENVENACETDTRHVLLPAGAGGEVVIRECATCKPVRMRVNRDTLYFVGPTTTPVTLDALRAAATAKGQPERMLTVFYSLKSGYVTRIVLRAA